MSGSVHGKAATCWVIVPVKSPGTGKTRLAGVLTSQERDRLVTSMLEHVVAAARACAAVERICLVSCGDRDLGPDVMLIGDPGGGLNPALRSALQAVAVQGSGRAIIVAADLPQVTAADLAMLADVPDDAVAIAPDRHGTGTNALSLPAGALSGFAVQFGVGSYSAHRAEANRLGYSVETMLSDGLAKDIDEPADLADAAGCLQEAS